MTNSLSNNCTKNYYNRTLTVQVIVEDVVTWIFLRHSGKVGRAAFEEVIIQLIVSKCMPILTYGLQACRLNKFDISSLDFVVNRLFMKMFNTNNMEIVRTRQEQFRFRMPSDLVASR